jgi:hypothetical protein
MVVTFGNSHCINLKLMSRHPNIVKIPKSGSNTLLILLLILFLAFVIGLGFFVSQKAEKEKSKGVVGSESQEVTSEDAAKTDKKEKKKGEIKEEVKKEKQKTTAFSGDFFTINYPETWQAKEINGGTVSFFANGAVSGLGEVTVSYKENKKNLPIERFYDGINDVNLFEDAAGGFVKTTVADYEAFKFKNLVGETNSTMVVIKLNNAFLEISDNFSKHQEDGIFDGFVGSVKVK